MSDIRPFRGYRPHPDHVKAIASPPYDVLDSDEARQMAQDNPLSFLRVVKAEIDFAPGISLYSNEVYERSAENLRTLIRDGNLVRDAADAFYVYQLRMGDHVQRGLVCGTSVQEYENGLIKKHEFTRREKEDDRARHVETLMANAGPVLLTYRASAEVDALVDGICSDAPVVDFTADDGIGHSLWVVSDVDLVAKIRNAFEGVEALYIADGHHRSASAFRVRNSLRSQNPGHTGEELYNHFLAVVFPDTQLRIMAYNRVVTDLNGLTSEGLLAAIAQRFDVAPADVADPPAPKQFGVFLDGAWYRLTAKAGTYPAGDPVKSLDVAILQDNLLAPILGIEDPRTDRRIDFVGGIRGTRELERRCAGDMEIGFALYPTGVDQLMAIADAGEVMPPKSTWFEPKLRSGVVVRSLEDAKAQEEKHTC
ncbi:MAG: DUF1015 family protein [Pseudomonadota bacterium]